MSVINQVLNQLEQRGAHTAAEQAMVRAVPQARRNFGLPLLAFGLALVAGIAAWQWIHARKPDISAAGVAQRSPNPAGAGNNSGADKLAKSTLPQQAAHLDTPVSGVAAAYMPASRLSFELSSIPLPSTIGHDTEQSSKNGKGTGAIAHAAKPARKSASKSAGKTVKSQPTATSGAELAGPVPDETLPMKQISPEQQADAEFRKATALVQQGRIDEAMSGYQAALRLDAGNDAARQALVALLLEKKRGNEAERVLKQGLAGKPDQTRFTMMLARLQVERGAVTEATATLENGLPYARSEADYQAFLAALLQRQDRNDEAVAHYQVALQLAPNNGIWLMGYGISLQALKRNADARVAFQHALDTRTLNPDLQAFVQQKLKQL